MSSYGSLVIGACEALLGSDLVDLTIDELYDLAVMLRDCEEAVDDELINRETAVDKAKPMG
jgi:hypothetical protein